MQAAQQRRRARRGPSRCHKQQHQGDLMKQSNKNAGRRLALTSVTLAVLTLMNQAQAQQAQAPEHIERVTVTGSSIKRLATENALPLTTYKAEELQAQGLTTMS